MGPQPIRDERGLVTEFNPDQIRAATDAFKAINADHPMVGAAIAIIGVLVGIVGLVNTVLTIINNIRTKKNTEAHNATAAMLSEHKDEMVELKKEAIKEIKDAVADFHDTVTFTKNQLVTEMNNIKIVVAKVNGSAEQKLSLIPKIQDAVTSLQKKSIDQEFKTAQTDTKLENFIQGLERIRRGKP